MPRGAVRHRLSACLRLSAPLLAAVLAMGASPAAAGPLRDVDPSTLTATELTPDSTYSASKSPDIAETDPALLGLTSSDPINVIIKYSYAPTASYAGGVDGLAATSPRKTGKSLKDNGKAVQDYESYLKNRESETSAAILAAVPSAAIGTSYTTVYGGVSATVPGDQVATILAVPGVEAVQKDSLQSTLAQDDATTFVGAAAVWPSLGGEAHAGQSVLIGLLDTGIWPESPFFADNAGLPAPPADRPRPACQFGDGSDTADLGATFTCNNKIVGAYAFTQTYMANIKPTPGAAEFCNKDTKVCSARDSEGHGTHTASTAAGDLVSSAVLYGVDRGPVSGMAPGAEIIEYRVCLARGCFSSDSVAAVQQAIHDGVDVLNFSISGGANPYTDAVEHAFLDAFNAGITVAASAGNSGPGSATTDHGGPWVITVGASTSDRFFTSTLNLAASDGSTFSMPGVTITNGIASATPVVLAETLAGEDQICSKQLAPGTATGKVVACQRGGGNPPLARVDKGNNVSTGGAAGMILYNPVDQDVETDNHWLPAIHVNGPPTALRAFISGHTGVTATWAQGTATPTQGDIMAAFSSRGPSAFFLKPDITAPGIQVLAGMTPQPEGITNGPQGNLFQAIAGTSMSAPHVAGSAVLVKAAHPDWTPAEIKSALMTSAAQGVKKEDGSTPATPFDDGAGSLRVNRAVNSTVVFDETFTDYAASSALPLDRVNLNLPSIDATEMSGQLTTTRTVTNVSGSPQSLKVSIQQPAQGTITVGNNNQPVNVKRDGSTTFSITISAPFAPNGQYFGRITLTPNSGNAVTIPVAFNKHQGAVTLTQSCAPTTVAATALSHCTATASNFAATRADVDLSVTSERSLHFQNTPGASQHSLSWSGSLTPTIAPPVNEIRQCTSPTVCTTPAGGYLPLSLLGVAPIPGVGDDTISNFNVPTFSYGGETYSRVGVVSNGYVVVGGGTSADIVFHPQTFPNTARPNNVIAPFWSDLNPGSMGRTNVIREAVISDGQTRWFVVDWDHVKNFSNPCTAVPSSCNTFEIWIQLAPAAEQISMVYGNISTGDPVSGVNWGAENSDGTSGKNIPAVAPGVGPAAGSQWRVFLGSPTPGGHQTLTYDLASDEAGTFTSTATMTSNLTAGTTQVPVVITVN